MDDYVSFYSRCYNNYGKVCSRIHFFTYELKCTETVDFKNASSETQEKLIKKEKEETSKGKHALTVLGYEEKDNKLTALFVHDDRYVPYARIDFIKDGLKICLRKTSVSDNADVELYKPLMLIYAFYPNGLIEQWGNTSESATSEKIVMFHIKFINIPFIILNINDNTTNADNYNFGFGITQESFKFKRGSGNTKVWFAFGY